MPVTIYHNPRCSKSRQALELLRSRGVEPRIVEYLEEPPSPDEIRELLGMLGIGARDLLRRKEAAAAGLGDPSLSEAALIEGMARHPAVIERPVVVKDGVAVIGRPPEKVLDII